MIIYSGRCSDCGGRAARTLKGNAQKRCTKCRVKVERERCREWYGKNAEGAIRRARSWYQANPERARAIAKKRRLANPRRYLGYQLWADYRLALEDYEAMMKAQKGRCAICKKIPMKGKVKRNSSSPRLHVDHCHKTDKVRELLCAECNNGIGRFQDDIRLLHAAVRYLRKHQ